MSKVKLPAECEKCGRMFDLEVAKKDAQLDAMEFENKSQI